MTQITNTANQYLSKQAVSWEQFKVLRSAFADITGVRLFYSEGILEIMGISKLHEQIVSLLTGLLLSYFALRKIKFYSTGAYTQSLEGVVEFQADLSFNFNTAKDISDLCIEVIITSGSAVKLKKYLLMQVPEVWFWENGKITIYILHNDSYVQVCRSYFLPDLDILHLESCLLMESQLDAILSIQEKYS